VIDLLRGVANSIRHPGAKKALAEIWNAEDRDHARRRVLAPVQGQVLAPVQGQVLEGLVALVRAGAHFINGKLIETPPSTQESIPDTRRLAAA
jgi:hypothetical protein